MRKFGLLFILFALVWNFQPVQAQESVEEAYKYGERCLQKIRNRRFRKFDESYTQALKDMDRLQKEAADKKFGYESLIEKIPNWIKLNDLLRKFDTESISNKGETITFEIKDYRALLEEVKVKAAKERFEAGKKLVSSYSNYDKSKEALVHFKKANSYSNEFNEEINKQKGIFCYKVGVEYSNSGDFDKVEKAREFFACTQKLNPEYKDVEAKLKKLDKKGAELLYNMAMEKEKEESFKAQIEAAKLYEKIAEDWIKDYKDADERAEAARDRSSVDLYFIGKDGKVLSNIDLHRSKKYINTPEPPAQLKKLDLRDEANYAKAVGIVGEGFILAKPAENFGEYEYMPPSTHINKKTFEAYAQFVYDTDGKLESSTKLTETEYKTQKKIANMGDGEGYEVKEVKGTATTKTKTNRMKLLGPLEIWDLRKPRSPIKLGDVDVGTSKSSMVRTTSWKGPEVAKPEHGKLNRLSIYKSDRTKLLPKEKLKKELLKEDTSVRGSVKRTKGLSYDLSKLIKYRDL